MPYTPPQALGVALFNAGVTDLARAIAKAPEVINYLEQMGFRLVDFDHTISLEKNKRILRDLGQETG